jgi:hypothetical protein
MAGATPPRVATRWMYVTPCIAPAPMAGLALTSCSGMLSGPLGATATWVAVTLEPSMLAQVAGGPTYVPTCVPMRFISFASGPTKAHSNWPGMAAWPGIAALARHS